MISRQLCIDDNCNVINIIILNVISLVLIDQLIDVISGTHIPCLLNFYAAGGDCRLLYFVNKGFHW